MFTRFFSTAVRGHDDWRYRLGDFAEQDLPTVDPVGLTIQRVGAGTEEKITVSVIIQKKAPRFLI